jgi:hypothetical protein
MKLEYHAVNDHKQLRQLVRILLLSQEGMVLSGIEARRLFNQLCGIDIDHHEYAYVLDEMTRTGEAIYWDHHGGGTEYRVVSHG